MAYQTVNLPRLVAQSTGAGAVTNGIGSLDDAEVIHIYMISTANAASTTAAGLTLQVSQFDPAIAAPVGVTQSTNWHTMSTALFPVATSSGSVHVVSPAGFRGLRLNGLTSAVGSEVIAYVSKQVLVS